MALGYAVGSIAGVALESGGVDCKTLILDGANLRATATANTQVAADGEVHTQVLEVGKGAAFGAKCEFIPPDVLTDIVDAINTAVAAGNSFTVSLQDDIQTIDVEVMPDFAAGWLRYPEQRTNTTTIKDVVFRFITV